MGERPHTSEASSFFLTTHHHLLLLLQLQLTFKPGPQLPPDFLMAFYNHFFPKTTTKFSWRGRTLEAQRERDLGSLGTPRYTEEGSRALRLTFQQKINFESSFWEPATHLPSTNCYLRILDFQAASSGAVSHLIGPKLHEVTSGGFGFPRCSPQCGMEMCP